MVDALGSGQMRGEGLDARGDLPRMRKVPKADGSMKRLPRSPEPQTT